MSLGKTVEEMINVENGGDAKPSVASITETKANAYDNVTWEKWTGTVIVDSLNVRNEPNIKGEPVAQYVKGDTINFDGWLWTDEYRWGTYVSYSGVRRYVAYGEIDGDNYMSW